MRFFRLDSSIRVDGSVTRALADVVEHEWRREHPGAELVRRDLGSQPLPAVWPEAMAARMTPENARTPEQRAATALAAELVDELLAADAVLLAVPMYNFSVPQQVKHWIDLIISDDRAIDIDQQWLAGRPAVLVEARGGGFAPGTPRQGWNHATPYLEHVLADLWGLDVVVVGAELTAADTDPAMAHLRELAEQLRSDARATASRHAAAIARRLQAAA